MTITPKNWKSFQHYTDRKPAWIKLHRGLLDDYKFSCLPVASRALAPLLWLLASEYEDGSIPCPLEELAFRFRMSVKELQNALNPLIEGGFFISASALLAECKQDATPEREREEEIQEEREKKNPRLAPGDWEPLESHFELAASKGLSREETREAAAEMRDWSIGNGKMRRDWNRAFNNWLRRMAKGKPNGSGRLRSLQDDSLSASKAADRLIDATKRGEFTIAPRPSLVPVEGQGNLRRLSKG